MRVGRFARVFQFDPVHPGTDAQQTAVMKALVYQVDTPYDLLNWRLATAIKSIPNRHCVWIGFYPDMLAPALSSPAAINVNDKIDTPGILWFLPHEVGHLVEYYLLSEEDKDWFKGQIGRYDWGMMTQEMFADAFRDWKQGYAWASMTPILLPDWPTAPPSK